MWGLSEWAFCSRCYDAIVIDRLRAWKCCATSATLLPVRRWLAGPLVSFLSSILQATLNPCQAALQHFVRCQGIYGGDDHLVAQSLMEWKFQCVFKDGVSACTFRTKSFLAFNFLMLNFIWEVARNVRQTLCALLFLALVPSSWLKMKDFWARLWPFFHMLISVAAQDVGILLFFLTHTHTHRKKKIREKDKVPCLGGLQFWADLHDDNCATPKFFCWY